MGSRQPVSPFFTVARLPANILVVRLDGLPFPAEYFDFVHIAGIGLGVPEDEVCISFRVRDVIKYDIAVAICVRGIFVLRGAHRQNADAQNPGSVQGNEERWCP
jgi:hypothetical protein